MTSTSPSDRAADPAPDPAVDAWTTSLDEPPFHSEAPFRGEPVMRGAVTRMPGTARLGFAPSTLAVLVALVAAALTAVAVVVSRFPEPSQSAPQPAPPPAPAALGTRMAVPVRIPIPDTGVVTADTSFVGVQVIGAGVVQVTVPEGLPGSRADELRSGNPAAQDLAGWLRRDPQVLVSSVRRVQVAGVTATQVDYQRSPESMPASEFARLTRFCAWAGASGSLRDADLLKPCIRIRPASRVRATFLPVSGSTVLVEAIWGTPGATGRPMPPELDRSYQALLSGVRPDRG